MPKRTLAIHVGPPKTGTSAVQKVFVTTRRPGILYPSTGRWPDGAHHVVIFALRGIARVGDVEIPPRAEVIGSLLSEIRGCDDDVLISSEALTPATFRLLLDELGPVLGRFDRIVALFVAREPIAGAASSYNQHVKDSMIGEGRSPDPWLDVSWSRFSIGPEIARWNEVVPALEVIPYEPAAGFVPRFLARMGLDAAEPADVGRPNRSMGGKALATLVLANRVNRTFTTRRRFWERLRADPTFRIWRGESFPFSPEAIATARERFADDHRILADLGGTGEIGCRHATHARFVLSSADLRQILSHISALPGYEDRRGESEAFLSQFVTGDDRSASR